MLLDANSWSEDNDTDQIDDSNDEEPMESTRNDSSSSEISFLRPYPQADAFLPSNSMPIFTGFSQDA